MEKNGIDYEKELPNSPLVPKTNIASEKEGVRPPPPGEQMNVQFPRHQVIPTRQVPRYNFQTSKLRKKYSCCRCLCCTICFLIALVAAIAIACGVLYLVIQPKIPKYSVNSIKITNFSINPELSTNCQFTVNVMARNPNKKIGIYYLDNSHLAVSYSGTELCRGALTVFYQGHKNTTLLDVALSGTSARLTSALVSRLKKHQQKARVPLNLRAEVPVKIKLGKLKSMKIKVRRKKFTDGQEIATFLASCGILSKALEESRLANNLETYSLNEYEGLAFVAFPSFLKIEGFQAVKESKYGEGIIQTGNKVFSECLKGNADQPALVHQGALQLFLHIMENTDFQAEMQIYTDSKQRKLKPIIFVGHSLGGAVATLATLWVLQKRLRQSSPFCITFGCPLVGDVSLVEAVDRENWAVNFLHVVSKHDIVPRMLLAPFESIAEPLIAILPYWQGTIAHDSKYKPESLIQDACGTLLNNVLQYTSTVTNYGTDSVRDSDGVMKRSPYRPFGTYMFCSSEGAACIENSEIVLKMFHLTMLSNEKPSNEIVQDCLAEHIRYDSVLKHVIEKSISGERSAKPDSESFYKMGISLQLEAIGVGAEDDHAQIALQIAAIMENKYNTNVAKLAIKLSEKQCNMAELEWYKERCEKGDGITYYDSFKKHEDSNANGRRLKLAEFWDEIIEMWEKHELPADFQSQNKWINAGNAYRRLVEPLDIAHYYRMSDGKGNYLSDGRPNRHKIVQKWMEEKEKTRSSRGRSGRTKLASLTQDSCFWAHVEEALKEMKNLKQGQHQKLENLEMFEGYVTRLINDRNISADVFLEGSSFMGWWKEWKKYKQSQFPEWTSPLYEIMETESWKG